MNGARVAGATRGGRRPLTSAKAWTVLIGSAVFETVWAIALGASEGFTQLVPTLVFFPALVISMIGLAIGSRVIPIGTAYGVWAGIGAVGTVLVAVAMGQQQLGLAGWLCMAVIIGAIVGLKLSTPGTPVVADAADATTS